MPKCHSCTGNCAACGGCAGSLELTQGELEVLEILGQVAFLPVARKADSMDPVCLEAPLGRESGPVLLCLEKKGLISLDYDKPLGNFDMGAYAGWPVWGSMALTARGQAVVELLELQGIQ